jgi:endonuclease/exonuclease/phosphatase (EEP) superfamily protein YafD
MERRGWRNAGTVVLALGLLAGVLAASVLFVASWAGELAASWTPHIAIGLLGLALIALLFGRRSWAVVQAVLAVVLLAGAAPAVLTSAQAMARHGVAESDADLRLVFANLNIGNTEVDALAQWLAEQDGDVIVVTEILPRHMPVLEAALVDYPWKLAEPRPHAFGQVIFSRLPLQDETVAALDAGAWSSPIPVLVSASVAVGEGRLRIAGFHPYPPLLPGTAPERDAQLRQAGDLLGLTPGPMVVTGDFNATAWSPALRDFARHSGLSGFNLAPTWPSQLGLAGIAIDHALVGHGVVITRLRIGPWLGSDHRPIVVDLALTRVQGSPGTP